MKKLIYFSIVLLFASACEKIVEIDIPSEDPRLVVESQLTTKKEIWTVKLSLSQPYFDQDSATAVSTALVNIAGSDGTDVDLNHTSNGLFVSDSAMQGKVGVTYTLTIVYNGETYIGQEEMANAFPIDIVESYFLPENNGFIESGYYVFIKGEENPYEGDSYLFDFYVNDTLQDGFGYLLENDEFGPISFLNPGVDPNNPLAGLPDILPRPFPFTVEPGDSIVVQQRNLSPKYYTYLIDLQTQLSRSGSPFDPPPSNLNNNLSNGALGYFSVAHYQDTSMVVQP